MCELGWKSLGVLELTALPSIKEEHWTPAVQEADALLVWGGSPLYLCYWMRQSGRADLLLSPTMGSDPRTAALPLVVAEPLSRRRVEPE
jgi:dipeptidase E